MLYSRYSTELLTHNFVFAAFQMWFDSFLLYWLQLYLNFSFISHFLFKFRMEWFTKKIWIWFILIIRVFKSKIKCTNAISRIGTGKIDNRWLDSSNGDWPWGCQEFIFFFEIICYFQTNPARFEMFIRFNYVVLIWFFYFWLMF